MSSLADLIARVEAATRPDREADRQLARMIGWHRVEPRFTRNRKGGWIKPEDFICLESDGSPRLDSIHGTDIWPDVPCFTASLDAALGLAERVLPGALYELKALPHRLGHGASLWSDDPAAERMLARADAPTPALALCLAILRAKAGDGSRTEGGA